MKFLQRLFNFFDLVAIEHVKHGKEGQESAIELDNTFKIRLRFFSLIILYVINYIGFKLIQIFTSWIFEIPLEDNHVAFPIILLLFVSEYGMTKVNIYTIKIFTLILVRSVAKYLLIYGIDILVISFLKWID